MHILITNDDGILAAGLHVLAAELGEVADVTVVAPERERSAVGHAITVHKPLRVNDVALPVTAGEPLTGYAVNGTPSDCVKIGVEALMGERPDLVVSGINRGPNLGTDIFYSGTVSAAVEAIILGLPSIAVSVDAFENVDYRAAAVFSRTLATKVLAHGLPPGTFFNVNVPHRPLEEIKGVRITRPGVRRYRDVFEQRTDLKGKAYYWLGGDVLDPDDDPETDSVAVKEGFISVSPIQFDLYKKDLIEAVRAWNLTL